MTDSSASSDAGIAAIADEVFATIGTDKQITPFSARPGGLTMADARRVAPLLRERFIARGETIVGRKIGFTNRTIWPQYGVYAPNWGYMTDRTVRELAVTPVLRLGDYVEPLIEPEIVFGFVSAPQPGMDDAALLDCVGWIAHGFEIVQSIYPGWKFTPPDTAAANAMHGALLIGARHAVAPRKAEWLRELPGFDIDLICNGAVVERGTAANVLEGPVSALRYLATVLAEDPASPPIEAGDIVTTGTLTKAMPVKPGETWRTVLRGVALDGIEIRFG